MQTRVSSVIVCGWGNMFWQFATTTTTTSEAGFSLTGGVCV